MSFLRTTQGTDFKAPSNWLQRLLSVDTANPGYRDKYHLIRSWLIEFDDNGDPWREIGLDGLEGFVVAGPSDEHYGFWLDTKCGSVILLGSLLTRITSSGGGQSQA